MTTLTFAVGVTEVLSTVLSHLTGNKYYRHLLMSETNFSYNGLLSVDYHTDI